ncbi:MAG: S8 family serine peptidase [Candidatus Poseidoniaceae archaeon]|nr:S8 family serine peptidase [Candidatus Poseidoniaceae archaeon]
MRHQWRPALGILLILLLSPWSSLIQSEEDEPSTLIADEFEQFSIRTDAYSDFVGELDVSIEQEQRAVEANSRIGVFTVHGLETSRPLSSDVLEPRNDVRLLLVNNERNLLDVRSELSNMQGIEVREYISPSGLLVQGTIDAFDSARLIDGIEEQLLVPLAMFLDDVFLDAMLFEQETATIYGQEVRVEGWRGEQTLDLISIHDASGSSIEQDLSDVASLAMDDVVKLDAGRYRGLLSVDDVLDIVRQPSVMWLRFEPQMAFSNDQSKNHMKISTMRSYFTTDLDGSGQIVAVADSGLDEDHGDFGTRVIGNFDVIGDGSTADKHSGHGTHVACTVLGDGTKGGYAGVAPDASLYFQAMENDNTGNFQSPSLNYLLNTAYNSGARIHTNSWGSSAASNQGKYTSESEDVDDRANNYDRVYNGVEGLTILFAAGNDGPNAGTVSSPSTAKNSVTVGNHQARYNGAPDNLMSGSSRGPTDDGRIKPDIIAPGGYVRSCRAQEAQDIAGSSWQSTWYLEYTGTSMATPNAAGASALIREYLLEIAQRPSPQGALIKALLVLGAQDINTRDIPNNDEGWGRVNLKETLAPSQGRGIWVDDRSVLSNTGQSKSYVFNVTFANSQLKTVLAWSDARGSRFSNNQLVNDLDLEVESPDGTIYLGNDFANGRSTTGGTKDDVNNLEVVLIDTAMKGIWTVRVKDGLHGGSNTQPFAIAVSGQGVNDLRPDPQVVANSMLLNVSIPQVGDQVRLTTEVFNAGNIKAESVDLAFVIDGVEEDRKTVDINPGASRQSTWYWTPSQSGIATLELKIDPDDTVDEIQENNNLLTTIVDVTAPGVKVTSNVTEQIVQFASQTTASWNLTLENTALLETNASIDILGVSRVSDGVTVPWYVGMTASNFTLQGKGKASISVTIVYPEAPEPGMYEINVVGIDVDNGITYPYQLYLHVLNIPEFRIEYDYEIVPVHPANPTNLSVRVYNDGNTEIGYDLFLQAPSGWSAGFQDLGSEPGASSGSTGLITKQGQKDVELQFIPPQVSTAAGAERMVRLTAISQTDPSQTWEIDIPIRVMEVREVEIILESNIGTPRPDATVNLLFTIENRGNVDLTFNPSMSLPPGWQVQSTLQPVEMAWTDNSENILISIVGNGEALSGQIALNLDNGSDRYSWSSNLEVLALPQPELTFKSLEFEDGRTFDHPFGPGSHPADQQLIFTWLLTNDAETTWRPDLSISLSQGLFGDCLDVTRVAFGDVVPVVCSVIIPSTIEVGSQPDFSFTLSGDDVSLVEGTSLLVAESRGVDWKVTGLSNIDDSGSGTIQVRLTNTGNVQLSHRLEVQTTEGLTASLVEEDIVNMVAGDSQQFTVVLTGSATGSQQLTFKLTGTQDVSTPTTTVDIDVTASFSESVSNSQTLLYSSVGIILVAVLLFGIITARSKKESEVISPEQKALPSIVQQQPAVMCWSCHGPIVGPMQGCPGCGARYHTNGTENCEAQSLEACANCGASVEQFVLA